MNSTYMMSWDGLFIISSDTEVQLSEAGSKFIMNKEVILHSSHN